MPAPLDDAKRQAIIDDLPSGDSCRSIATRHDVSPDTVSRIARDEGHVFGRTNLAHARDARKAYSAERRALQAARLADLIDRQLGRLETDGPYVVFNFGGRDNTYAEHELDHIPDDAMRTMSQTLATWSREARELAKHDEASVGQVSDLDAFLAHLRGEQVPA